MSHSPTVSHATVLDGVGLDNVGRPVLALLTSRRAVDLCRVGSCLCRLS